MDSKVARQWQGAVSSVCHFSISSGGRTDVRRHQESAGDAKLAKRMLYERWDSPSVYAHSAIFRQPCSALNML